MSQTHLEQEYGISNTTQKGDVGERTAEKIIKRMYPEYECIHRHFTSNEDGPDLIFKHPRTGEILIVEAKFFNKWTTENNLITKIGGEPCKELSDYWLKNDSKIKDLIKSNPSLLKNCRRIHIALNYDIEEHRVYEVLQDSKNPKDIRFSKLIDGGKWRHEVYSTLENFPSEKLQKSGYVRTPFVKKLGGTEKSRSYMAKAFAESRAKKSPFPIRRIIAAVGLITRDGSLVAFLNKSPWGEAVIVLAIEGGNALYRRSTGEISQFQFNRMMMGTAFKSPAVGGAAALAIFLGATRGGIVVLGVATGAYFIADKVYTTWEEHQRNQFLTPQDLYRLGIEIEPVFDFKNPNIPFSFRNADAPFNFRNSSSAFSF